MSTTRSITVFCLAAMFAASGLAPAKAYTLKTIYAFCQQFEDNCADGGNPRGALLRDASGNLYGVTAGGGAHGGGTIYELLPAAHGGWKHKVLYSFCSVGTCQDGAEAQSGLIGDTSGNLYGTTSQGGKYSQGAVYELMPNASRTRWRLRVLHSFCPGGDPDCPDGAFASAPLSYAGVASGALYDGASPLYGSTTFGGVHGWGTVFRLAPVQGKKTWSLKTLYSFCSKAACADGAAATWGVTPDTNGNLFGATQSGQGSNNNGVVFELSSNAKGTKWSETVLYSFCSLANCFDGMFPNGGIAMDGSGDLFGVTAGGGSGTQMCFGSFGCGVAYEIVPSGASSKETVLYNFCSLSDCGDGNEPIGRPLVGASGDVFGATAYGGGNDVQRGGQGAGTIFVLNETYQRLYSFCAASNCLDGAQPVGNMIEDISGNIYGIASGGGVNGPDGAGGTVFELSP